MTIKDKVDERLEGIRSSITEQHKRLEDTEKALQERAKAFREEWKKELIRTIDQVFYLVFESMEKALDRIAKITHEATGFKAGEVDEPMVTSSNWIQ